MLVTSRLIISALAFALLGCGASDGYPDAALEASKAHPSGSQSSRFRADGIKVNISNVRGIVRVDVINNSGMRVCILRESWVEGNPYLITVIGANGRAIEPPVPISPQQGLLEIGVGGQISATVDISHYYSARDLTEGEILFEPAVMSCPN